MELDADHFYIGVGEERANLLDRKKKFNSIYSRLRSSFETIVMPKKCSSKEILGKNLLLAQYGYIFRRG